MNSGISHEVLVFLLSGRGFAPKGSRNNIKFLKPKRKQIFTLTISYACASEIRTRILRFNCSPS